MITVFNFCATCGHPIHFKDRILVGGDGRTGRAIYTGIPYCPNDSTKWYQPGHDVIAFSD